MFEEWLIAHPEVQIVLSSTWRMTKNPIERPFGWKFRIRKESPIICDRIISVTPRHKDSYRGREITEWLEAHPEVTHWCIIDDDDFDQTDFDHLVKTKTSIGLTQAHMRMVEGILDV